MYLIRSRTDTVTRSYGSFRTWIQALGQAHAKGIGHSMPLRRGACSSELPQTLFVSHLSMSLATGTTQTVVAPWVCWVGAGIWLHFHSAVKFSSSWVFSGYSLTLQWGRFGEILYEASAKLSPMRRVRHMPYVLTVENNLVSSPSFIIDNFLWPWSLCSV